MEVSCSEEGGVSSCDGEDSSSCSPHESLKVSPETSLDSGMGAELILSPLDPLDIINNAHNTWLNESHDYREPTASHIFSVAMGLSRGAPSQRGPPFRSISSPVPYSTATTPSPPPSPHAVFMWKEAARKALNMQDPWREFHMESLPAERVLRHRYNALSGEWVQDEIVVKIGKNQFGRGAMRECFRLKRQRGNNTLSSINYVAKRYLDETTDRETYFEDVKLQMDAKTWGEEYNRHNPPKKVDICQMAVIEFVDRPHRPLYHLEHFIEGHYVKYNSNSGFISTDRLTPQAFSHFTFERSGHELVVVDIQGVGDLYTDPQIHTASGKHYGEGNLGVRGMALFFHSHQCNPICESLGLTPFDMCPTERAYTPTPSALSKATRVRGSEEPVVSRYNDRLSLFRAGCRLRTYSSPADLHRPTELLQRLDEERGAMFRCASPAAAVGGGEVVSPTPYAAPVLMRTLSNESSGSMGDFYDPIEHDMDDVSDQTDSSITNGYPPYGYSSRQRLDSECSSVLGDDNDRQEFQRQIALRARASGVDQERARKLLAFEKHFHQQQHNNSNMCTEASSAASNNGGVGACCSSSRNSSVSSNPHERSILGQIHIEMTKCYQAGRFNASAQDDPSHYNRTAAMFHLTQSAKCGQLEGVLTLARIHLGLPHDLLCDVNIPNAEQGLEYLIQAAEAGDRASMIEVAKAFDTGELLAEGKERDWREAAYWYDRAIETTDEDEGGEYDGCIDHPAYQLLARQAEMYMQGDFGLGRDTARAAELYQAAAESATAAMKGRMANKYFSLAEEALAADNSN